MLFTFFIDMNFVVYYYTYFVVSYIFVSHYIFDMVFLDSHFLTLLININSNEMIELVGLEACNLYCFR